MVQHRLLRTLEGVAVLRAQVLQRSAHQPDGAKRISETVRSFGSSASCSRENPSHIDDPRWRYVEDFRARRECCAADESLVPRSTCTGIAVRNRREECGCLLRAAGE